MMHTKLNIIIIDDEQLARDIIKNYLLAFPNISLLAECNNGFEGAKKIQELNPDLIFLDIQMPKISGFEMLEIVDQKPEIIFTTAYDQYAIKAFEQNAVDYLLKPFPAERFEEAIHKALDRIKHKSQTITGSYPVQFNPKNNELSRIVVKNGADIHIIPIDEVCVIEAQDDYVMIYTKNKKYLKQQTMKYYEEFLNPQLFTRIHRSYIIKDTEIHKIEPFEKESYLVITKDNMKIRASKSGYKKLKSKLSF